MLDALTQLFLSCKDLDEDEVREALRGFGYEVERDEDEDETDHIHR